mgnify:CR=1 FL=1
MKLGKVIALMLVLLPFSMGAQEVDRVGGKTYRFLGYGSDYLG